MIDRTDPLPITKQAKMLGVSRSVIYYLPAPISAIDQQIMVRIDRLHL
jgi:putative transposase